MHPWWDYFVSIQHKFVGKQQKIVDKALCKWDASVMGIPLALKFFWVKYADYKNAWIPQALKNLV